MDEEEFRRLLESPAAQEALRRNNADAGQLEDLSFSQIVDAIFFQPFSNSISLFFIIMIISIFVASMLVRRAGFSPQTPLFSVAHKNAIATLPALGVLGTFVGVLVAVDSFDPGNIQGSISKLLQGLAIAFSTSIWGLGTSVVLRFFPERETAELEGETTAEDVYDAIQSLQKSNEKNLSELIKAISGDSERSLNTQISLMRQDLSDFAKELAKTNTDALIDALKGAIQEFNENLAEQFGSNFAQLNEAVGKLLEWQENNKRDMEELRKSLDASVASIDRSAMGIERVENSLEGVASHLSQLGSISELLEKQVGDLESKLAAFADMAEQANNAMPKIEEILSSYTKGLEDQLSEILRQVSDSVASASDASEALALASTSAVQAIDDASQDTQAKVRDVIEKIGTTSSNTIQTIADASVESVTNFSQRMQSSIDTRLEEFADAGRAITDAANQASSASTQLISTFSQATEDMSDQLKQTLQDVGEELTAQTQSFGRKFADQLDKVQGAYREAAREFAEGMKGELEEQVSEIRRSVQNHVKQLESTIEGGLKSMKEEQEKLIDTELQQFADRLGQISERLASKYAELTQSIERINRIVSNLDDS